MASSNTTPGSGISVTDHAGVMVVALDRPPANALNRQLIREFTALFTELASRSTVPAVVVIGAGDRFFTAGGDIKELDGVQHSEISGRMTDFQALLVGLDRYPAPVVAAINGHCVGGGLEIALFADSVLSVAGGRFGFPEINHGLLPADKGIQRAVRIVGTRATRGLLLSGELIDAEQAQQIGLVSTIVEPDALLDTAISAARSAGDKAPVLYAALKRSVNDPDDEQDERSLRRTLAAAAEYFDDPTARALREGWRSARTGLGRTVDVGAR
ncbi:enoyl-CoA hydratase/isomerase family protein [Tsukamurella tyrosinosolvens]|uniref:enoyl-CoA hydratase/isomerase family protein n=1 Tax=Tsukamurella tyrosinosolvens TaxID=57704 RepID=UPI000C7F33AF|nr:enoyl-CoA hydratase/isomerase family protein [Tsukamurella tyrosinosolvens]AUN41818.1 enoyl-CoA hydratase [Tsukamurella tyrosinosolvens]